jgi:hypothetical protein
MVHPWLELDEEALMEKMRNSSIPQLIQELKTAIGTVDGKVQRLFAVKCASVAYGIAPMPYVKSSTKQTPSGTLIEAAENPDATLKTEAMRAIHAAEKMARGIYLSRGILKIQRDAEKCVQEEFRAPLHYAYRAAAATLLSHPKNAAIEASNNARECARIVSFMVSKNGGGDREEARLQFKALREIWQDAKKEEPKVEVEKQKQYARRNPLKQDEAGGYYIRHVEAMTAEGLHEKSAIAAELAHRDIEIVRLSREVAFYAQRMDALQKIQSKMRDPERKAVCDILANGSTDVFAVKEEDPKVKSSQG